MYENMVQKSHCGWNAIEICRLALLVTVAIAIDACATPDRGASEGQQLEDGIFQANTAAKSGDSDKALQMFDRIAKEHPAAKEPWLRASQIQFDKGNYGQAIVAAQEVIQRDPADTVARSVLTVAGLRVSVRALGELRSENNLAGSTRSEAQALAAALRDALGETTLVPAAITAPAVVEAKPVAANRSPARSAGQPRKLGATPNADPAATSMGANTKPKTSGNPFGALQ